ncbi:hypothetical protein [uncultured Treponema sp.]|nr:hypothetical protein [uncultured Treponema sp.]
MNLKFESATVTVFFCFVQQENSKKTTRNFVTDYPRENVLAG